MVIIRLFYVLHWVFWSPLWLLLCPECKLGSKYSIWLKGLLAGDERMPLNTKHNLMNLHLSGRYVWSSFIKWAHTYMHAYLKKQTFFRHLKSLCICIWYFYYSKKRVQATKFWKRFKITSTDIHAIIYVCGWHLYTYLNLGCRKKSKALYGQD